MIEHPPFRNAGNAGPFTLDGTRTYRVGDRSTVVLDPGPDVAAHVRALVVWLQDADEARVVVTHGHRDHAGGARSVADALGVPVLGPEGVVGVDAPLGDGDRIRTDAGTLVALETPGHAEHHLCFAWPEREAMFVGDLMLGAGDTTWVGEYAGCVEDYLESLRKVRRSAPRILYPAHGDPITDPNEALDRYEAHRRARLRQVADVLESRPDTSPDGLVVAVYGSELPSAVAGAARRSVEALVEYVRSHRVIEEA